MSSNPDEIYRRKAASDPVAPATLWLYPCLRFVEGAQQRRVLNTAKRKARSHWLSYFLRFSALALVVANGWALATERSELGRLLTYTFPLLVLAWLLHDFFRTRMELRSGRLHDAERTRDAASREA